jgi:hypothetical protein
MELDMTSDMEVLSTVRLYRVDTDISCVTALHGLRYIIGAALRVTTYLISDID